MTTDWITMHHGTCPGCKEHKFIGHGPLCVECYIAETRRRGQIASRGWISRRAREAGCTCTWRQGARLDVDPECPRTPDEHGAFHERPKP